MVAAPTAGRRRVTSASPRPRPAPIGGAGDGQRLRLAEALAIERLHGPAGPAWIAAKIGALALAGDEAGVSRFRAIAAAYEELLANRRH